MGLREIRQQLGKLCGRLLTSAVEKVPERTQAFQSAGDTTAHDWAQCKGPERRSGTSREGNGHFVSPSASTQPKAGIAAGATAAVRKQLCADDIARGILGTNSGATISNVLVVGTNGSTPLKRVEIRFDDPEQVPAFFHLLASALKNNGFELYPARNSGIPASEIWLTCPLNECMKTSVSCACLTGEQVAAWLLSKPALH